MINSSLDRRHMLRALELAALAQGHVEPNPMVGCVIATGEQVLAEGYHRQFGGAHAEIDALQNCQHELQNATLYVTLEPCCHHGKTPPCTEALIQAGIRRVVVAMGDPFSAVAGGGIEQLKRAGIAVEVGTCADEAQTLNAPYLMRIHHGRPWIIAKWAMSLDGKIATATGESKWISNASSREIVHALRGRVDAVMVGKGTAIADDPMLTARPRGARTATRIVVDSHASIPLDSALVRTAQETPVTVVVGPEADPTKIQSLEQHGCEVWLNSAEDRHERLQAFLAELAAREQTNLLVEGGGELLGALWDLELVDEVHAFIGNRIIGGSGAPGPIGGNGTPSISGALKLDDVGYRIVDDNVYVQGTVRRT